MAVGYAPISSSAPRPLGAAYVPILLSEVEQEQRPSGNQDREAIVVEADLCEGEGERAYTIYDRVLGWEKYLKYFERFAGAKTLQERNNSISKLSIHFRSRFSLTQKFDSKIPHQRLKFDDRNSTVLWFPIWNEGKIMFVKIWNEGKIMFVRKPNKEDDHLAGNFRPITLTSFIGKLFERKLEHWQHLKNFGLVDDNQEGFPESVVQGDTFIN